MYYDKFIQRTNLYDKHMLSPSSLFSKIIGVLARDGGEKWNQYHRRVGNVTLEHGTCLHSCRVGDISSRFMLASMGLGNLF